MWRQDVDVSKMIVVVQGLKSLAVMCVEDVCMCARFVDVIEVCDVVQLKGRSEMANLGEVFPEDCFIT